MVSSFLILICLLLAIYKLKELYSKKPEYGIGATAQSIGMYKYVRQSDIQSKEFPTYVNEGPELKYDDVLISRAGANSGATYIHKLNEGYVFAGFLVRYNFKQSKLLNSYFYYWTKSNSYVNQIKSLSNSGSTMPKLNPPVVGSMNINLPPLKHQQEIIDIIKPIEDMINNLINAKNNILKIIDSIPINFDNSNINWLNIKTGKRNANHENIDGQYNFYTCGEKIRKCSDYSFDGQYILLSGNANLYSWWYNGKFDLYQRVYALEPKNNFFTSYHAVRNAMQKLREESAGSVIKYIKKTDIENIKMLNPKYESELNILYTHINSIETTLTHLYSLQEKAIQLLIK